MIRAQMVVSGVEIPEFLEENIAELWDKAARHALRNEWHKKSYPSRFKSGARRKFGYAPRSAAYNKRKQKVHGHRREMVWSGELERTSTKRISIKSRKKGEATSAPTGARGGVGGPMGFVIRFSMKVPKHMTYGTRKRERDELTVLPKWELAWLNGKISTKLDRVVRREVNKYRKRRKVLYGYGDSRAA